MSHLFTVKAVQKIELDLVTSIFYAKEIKVHQGAGGGYRVRVVPANTPDRSEILLLGNYSGVDGHIDDNADAFDNVHRCERVYVENMTGATVQSLKSNIVKPTPFPEEDRVKNEAIRQGALKTKTGKVSVEE